jgi:hypothetical protein
MQELRAEAQYHRERFELYKARSYGSRPTSLARLRELERRHQAAAARLRAAQQDDTAEQKNAPDDDS